MPFDYARHQSRAADWTEAEDDLLTQLIRGGHSYRQASNVIGRSPGACAARWARLYGPDARPRKERRLPWSAEDDRRLLAMHGQFKGYDQIAEALGRTRSAVGHRLAYLRRRAHAERFRPKTTPRQPAGPRVCRYWLASERRECGAACAAHSGTYCAEHLKASAPLAARWPGSMGQYA
jgi:hypothetical protein